MQRIEDKVDLIGRPKFRPRRRITMSKKLVCAFTVTLALSVCMLVLSCKKTSPPNSTAPEELTTVEITFDGLMVFRQVADHYEVGVLDSHQVNHKLRITVGDK